MLTKEYILDKSGEISSEVISMRRELHRLAETGGEAKRTGEYIRAKLTELEIPFEQDHETNSLLACIDTDREGPSIGLRADMDAHHNSFFDVDEDVLKTGVAASSDI